MSGSAQRRFCAKCRTEVHDLSTMTEREARALVDAHRGSSICIRYRHRDGGVPVFRSEPRGRGGFVAILSLAMAACSGYVEAESLEAPDRAQVCHDADGYAVDCELVDQASIPDVRPEPEVGEGGVEGEVIGHTMGAVSVADYEVTTPVVACPLPPPTIEPDTMVTLGAATVVVEETRAQSRRRRRREDRHERRRARRERRRRGM